MKRKMFKIVYFSIIKGTRTGGENSIIIVNCCIDHLTVKMVGIKKICYWSSNLGGRGKKSSDDSMHLNKIMLRKK